MMPVSLQPAFVLHRRSYRETSLIVELFTLDYGRVAAVARGVRKARSRTAPLLQPFMPLLVSWYGKGELLTLTQIEGDAASGYFTLSNKNLRCGFYLNELLLRLLPKSDPHPQLFMIYKKTLAELRQQGEGVSESVLRLFEKKLLIEIGYGLPLNREMLFSDEHSYCFDLEHGFLPYTPADEKTAATRVPEVFGGKTLNALLNEDFHDQRVLQDIKRLMRFIFSLLLGSRPLQSRKLFE